MKERENKPSSWAVYSSTYIRSNFNLNAFTTFCRVEISAHTSSPVFILTRSPCCAGLTYLHLQYLAAFEWPQPSSAICSAAAAPWAWHGAEWAVKEPQIVRKEQSRGPSHDDSWMRLIFTVTGPERTSLKLRLDQVAGWCVKGNNTQFSWQELGHADEGKLQTPLWSQCFQKDNKISRMLKLTVSWGLQSSST